MAQPYVGEIRIFAGNFAPAGWMLCEGQLLPISENETLFTLLGTTYGGDGQSTFGLPDLRGRLPVHQGTLAGQTFTIGQAAGVESVTLTAQQIPVHTHPLNASTNNAAATAASGNLLAQTPSYTPYGAFSPISPLNAAAVGTAGGSQPHDNLQPYLCLNFIISLFGIFPTQT